MKFFSRATIIVALAAVAAQQCATDLDCSLNGQCTAIHGNQKLCLCDPGWTGSRCGHLSFAPSPNATTGPAMAGRPLCCYHGDDNRSYSWGASVQLAAEDGLYYMWVAEMVNHCTISNWRTNSDVQLARSSSPLGPFVKVADIIAPWAHNPQTIVTPDLATKHGYVYAVYTLGNGVPQSGPPVNCTNFTLGHTDHHMKRVLPTGRVPSCRDCHRSAGRHQTPGTTTANFTIHWAEEAKGPYRAYNASILNWPLDWDYGAHGNWNPSPYQHPNGSVYLMAHTSWRAFCGEAIVRADTWRGPYVVVASDTYTTWGGSACHVEDPVRLFSVPCELVLWMAVHMHDTWPDCFSC